MTVDLNLDPSKDSELTPMKSKVFHSTLNSHQHQQKIKRQNIVRWLKKLFIAIPVFGLISFFVWLEISKRHEQATWSPQDFKDEVRIRNRLGAPRIHSVDDKGQPYSLKADTALQKDKHVTYLEAPHSTMKMTDGTTLNIQAYTGLYNDITKTLDYQQEVTLKTDTGYQFKTSRAFVNLQKKEAFGDQQVVGEGPAGKIWSEGFEAHESGMMRFKGKSRLVINKINLESMKTETEKEKP